MDRFSRIIFLGLISALFMAFWSTARADKTCIIKGNKVSKDLYKDELELEDPAYYYQRRIWVKVQVFQRCGARLCKSRYINVYRTTCSRGCLRKCWYSRRSSAFFCKSYRRSFDIKIRWQKYHKTLVIKRIYRKVSLKAVMPSRLHYQKLYLSRLSVCNSKKFPKSIIITDKIQGKHCPSDRLRYSVGSKQDLTKRTLDGRLNNPKKIFNGAVGENLLRLSGNGYADKVSIPSGACSKRQRLKNTCPYPKENNGTGSNRPNPRVISNLLMKQNEDIPSKRHLSDLSVYFGQFLDHDTDLTGELPRTFVHTKPNDVELNINVPKGDVILDVDAKGSKSIPVRRFNFDNCTGERHNTARQHVASISAIVDANTVYGSDEKHSRLLRTLKDGLMKTSNGHLPLNTFNLKMANAIGRDPTKLHAAGDVRANVAPTLLVLHTLFVREHNRLARAYKRRHPKANDETIFQYARKMVIAEMQAITYREYIPSLIGKMLPKYKGYNPKINTGIATEFSTACFRFGHSQINTKVFRFDKNGEISPYGHILLREAYFTPERVTKEGGLEPILRGAIEQPAQAVDTKIVDEMRNFLFLKKGVGLDLAAINIQRGRETGIPDYNKVRKALGLKRVTSFNQITKDRKVAQTLKSLYRSVNNLDLWIGGLAEDHLPGSELGPTFQKIFINQMTRLRDGDRFWYTRILSQSEIRTVHKNTLSRIIRLNTAFKNPPENVFFAHDG